MPIELFLFIIINYFSLKQKEKKDIVEEIF
jgi:hypothetical protein